MPAMAYVFDIEGNEIDRGTFDSCAGAPKRADGSYDKRYRKCVGFAGKIVSAADYGLEEIRVKVWTPSEGTRRPRAIWFNVRGNEESQREARAVRQFYRVAAIAGSDAAVAAATAIRNGA